MDKVMLHCDMNNYFASVECVSNEKLKSVPMVVCGDPATRHGVVLSKNDPAKKLGILTGESLYSARAKVPYLAVINADYPKYIEYAKRARNIYACYSDEVIPYGLDEAWINLTSKVGSIAEAKAVADEIRERIKNELKITASIGVSFNYIFSKLASDMKKPDATTVLSRDEYKTVIRNTPAFEMLFVGPATRKKLMKMNILTIGDLADADVRLLQKTLGKNGVNLCHMANGDDSSFDPKVPVDEPFKSFGNTVTTPKDLTDEADILAMLYILSGSVSMRLRKHSLKAKCVKMNIKYSDFTILNRQLTLSTPTHSDEIIFTNVKKLFDLHYNGTPVRSLGVQVSSLNNSGFGQLSLFEGEDEASADIKELITKLKNRIGEINFMVDFE